MLGMGKPTYDISISELESKFKSLQRLVHPDRFTTKTKQEQSYSSQHAMSLNSAYTTLKDPLARGRYLLYLRDPSLLRAGAVKEKPEVLAEILEIREEIDSAISILKAQGAYVTAENDTPMSAQAMQNNPEVVEAIQRLINVYLNNQRQMKSLENKLKKAFDLGMNKKAAQYLSRMSYLCSIEVEVKAHVPWDALAAAIQASKPSSSSDSTTDASPSSKSN